MKQENLELGFKLKQRILKLLEDIKSDGEKFELPETSKEYEDTVKELYVNVFSAAVLGEAKRGKSSLINALLGKKILPVEEEIATSKAFYIANSDTESCYVRYMDDSSEEIGIEDIDSIGSQKEENRLEYEDKLDVEDPINNVLFLIVD